MSLLPCSLTIPSDVTAARRDDEAESPSHYTKAQVNVDVASFGQLRSRNKVKAPKVGDHGHILQHGISKRISPCAGIVSELRESPGPHSVSANNSETRLTSTLYLVSMSLTLIGWFSQLPSHSCKSGYAKVLLNVSR